MTLGDPAFGPTFSRAVALNGELVEALRECFERLNTRWSPRLGHTEPACVAKARLLLKRIEGDPLVADTLPRPASRVRLQLEVDLDNKVDWSVSVVPGSGDNMPPGDILSTVLTHVASQHAKQLGHDQE